MEITREPNTYNLPNRFVVGDIIENPYVGTYYKNGDISIPNPLKRTMVIKIGTTYIKALRYDGEITEYYTSEVKKNYSVVAHINIQEIISSLYTSNKYVSSIGEIYQDNKESE
jgi:hypothetical protein